MKSRTFLVAGFMLALAWLPMVGRAQNLPATRPDTVVFSVETGLKYEDNRDATRRNREDMLTLRFTPGITLNVDDPTTRAYLRYRASLLWRDNPRIDQNDTELQHDLEASISRDVSGRFFGGLKNRFQVTDDPDVTAGGVSIREDASYWINQFQAWAGYLLTERLQADVQGSYMVKRYDEERFQDLGDENRFKAELAFRYRLTERDRAVVFGAYDEPHYREGVRGDYRGYVAGVGWERKFGERGSGRLSAGYQALDYDDAIRSDEGIPYVSAGLSLKPVERFVVDAEASYSLEPSDRSLYSSKEYSRFLVRGTVTVTESLAAFGQAVYANGAYKADRSLLVGDRLVDDQPVVDGDDTLVDLQAGLRVAPKGSRFSGQVAYEYEDWNSDVRESFVRNTVTASLAMEF